MNKLRYVGKLQRKVLYALIEKPLTKVGVIHTTGMSPNNVDIALKSLIYKDIILKDGIHFKIKEEDENTTESTISVIDSSTVNKPAFYFDVQEGTRDFKSTVSSSREEQPNIVSAK